MAKLTQYEREIIQDYHELGYTQRDIAKKIKRHHSIVGKELKRNTPQFGQYQANLAHALALARAGNTNKRKLDKDLGLQLFVTSQLKEGLSPEQIAGIIKYHPP